MQDLTGVNNGGQFALGIEPVVAEELDRMLSADGAIAAAQVVGGTTEVASPADTLRMFRMERELRHEYIVALGSG